MSWLIGVSLSEPHTDKLAVKVHTVTYTQILQCSACALAQAHSRMLRIIRLVNDYGCTTTQAHVLCSILHALGDSNNTQPSELMVHGNIG